MEEELERKVRQGGGRRRLATKNPDFLKKIKYNKTRITAAISRIAENFPPEAPLEAGRSGSGSGSRRGMFGTALTRIVSSA